MKFPRVVGVTRQDGREDSRTLLVHFVLPPTDEELRAFHDYVREMSEAIPFGGFVWPGDNANKPRRD